MIRRVVLAALLVLVVGPSQALAQKAVFLVRHAERLNDSSDTPLSPAGEARATRLAAMLADAGVAVVYVTQFQRTRQTAQPLATARGLTLQQRVDTDSAGLVATLRTTHKNDVVLVVAHSHTIPEILKRLGHATPVTIAADEFDNLFVVVPAAGRRPPTVVRLRY